MANPSKPLNPRLIPPILIRYEPVRRPNAICRSQACRQTATLIRPKGISLEAAGQNFSFLSECLQSKFRKIPLKIGYLETTDARSCDNLAEFFPTNRVRGQGMFIPESCGCHVRHVFRETAHPTLVPVSEQECTRKKSTSKSVNPEGRICSGPILRDSV
jgi:hypothetical protein